ncbi:MAG: hypothetical protein ACE5EH_11715 [Gammaproteobacteria bacterium]
MTCRILTEDRWQRLLKGKLSDDEKLELSAHIASDCPDCEYLIAQLDADQEKKFLQQYIAMKKFSNERPKVDDSHVRGSASNATGAVDISANRAQAKASFLTNLAQLFFGGSGAKTPAWVGAFAVVVVTLTLLLPNFTERSEKFSPTLGDIEFNEKGNATPLASINLQFATGRLNSSGDVHLTRGVNGGSYSRAQSLFLNYRLIADGYVYLFGIEEGKKPVRLEQNLVSSLLLQPGEYTYPGDDATQGLALTEINGYFRVIGVYSDKPLKNIEQVMQSLAGNGHFPETDHLSKLLKQHLGQEVAIDSVFFNVVS